MNIDTDNHGVVMVRGGGVVVGCHYYLLGGRPGGGQSSLSRINENMKN